MEYQKLPKWFDGVVYKNYETVQNPFSGEQIKLNPNEVAMYDLCKGAEMLGQWTLLNKCLSWFRTHSPTAYMVLLD